MMKQQAVAILTLVVSMYVMSVESNSCSVMDHLRTCFPNISRYMERPINVSIVVLALGSSSNMPGIETRCTQFNKLTECVKNSMASCDQPPIDAESPVVKYWENAKEAIEYMCNEHKQEFLDSQQCMSSSDLRSEAAACGIPHDGHRRKRHTCSDYEKEILCADGVVTKQCGVDVARRAGHMMRIFLKNSPTTYDCKAPAFSSAEGIRSVSTVLAFSMTSAILAMLKML